MTALIPRCDIEWDSRCILPLHHIGICEMPDPHPCGIKYGYGYRVDACELFSGHGGPHTGANLGFTLQWGAR